MVGSGGSKKRELVQPQLIPMLGIFSLITLFLIGGAIFGESSIIMPQGLELPDSVFRSEPDSAPQITLLPTGVQVDFLGKTIDYGIFDPYSEDKGPINSVKKEIRQYLKTRAPRSSDGPSLTLNVVADRNLQYDRFFDVISVFRESGFELLSFVATQEAGK